MKINRKLMMAAAGVIGAAALVWAVSGWLSGNNRQLTLSGTIEATEIRLSTRNGGMVKQILVKEGDPVTAGEPLAQIVSPDANLGERITSPINGVLLERLFEPDELASTGSVVIVVADLGNLQLKVYGPEERYGQFSLGQVYPVTVDFLPGKTFNGRVSRIADKAEFTPRNVQTIEGRKSTVFAITLDIENSSEGNLIPGMPADVHITLK